MSIILMIFNQVVIMFILAFVVFLIFKTKKTTEAKASGIYLAQTDLKKMFVKASPYGVSLVRRILVPTATPAVLSLFPDSMQEMKIALRIAGACPAGSNVAVYAQLHNRDYSYEAETVVISTALSLVTIPLIVGVAARLWM